MEGSKIKINAQVKLEKLVGALVNSIEWNFQGDEEEKCISCKDQNERPKIGSRRGHPNVGAIENGKIGGNRESKRIAFFYNFFMRIDQQRMD